MGQVGYYVPRQTTYPATFMASVSTTNVGKPFEAFLAFRRESATTPWLLAFAGGLPVSSTDGIFPAADSDGYLLPQSSAPLFDPATAHTQLASYWRDAKRTRAIPPSDIFTPGVWTTEWAKVLSQHGQGRVAANGLVGYYAYQADPVQDPLFTYPEGQGWQIACSAVGVETTFTGARSGRGPFQDNAHQNWGPEIAPGAHKAVVYTKLSTPCIEIPPAGSGQLARVLGAAEVEGRSPSTDATNRGWPGRHHPRCWS